MSERFRPASKCSHRILYRLSSRCEDASILEDYYDVFKGSVTKEPVPEAKCNHYDVRRFRFKIASEVNIGEIQSPNSK